MNLKSILLIVPEYHDDTGILALPFIKAKAFMPPLQVATIAALTPNDIEVNIWDEVVHGRIDEKTELGKNYDLIGLTSYVSDLPRAKTIAEIFRKRGTPVVIGGSGVSSAPEQCRDSFDILFIGEAELTWPQFIADWQSGNHQTEYRQIDPPDLSTSPLPRWDLLAKDMKNYFLSAVQTTRGCPFDCEFCDVIYLFGRQPRHKPIDHVLEEIRLQKSLGVERIFICDDNFIGSPQYTKDLLQELVPLNNSFDNPLQFSTQLSIDLAKNDKILELLADANFSTLFIGIESINKESLKESGKIQNYRMNLVEACKKVQSYGMFIRGSMIVGFDHDDTTVFDKQFEFLQEACIPIPRLNLLKAPRGTRLWARLLREGRIIQGDSQILFSANPRAATNIIPKMMTRAQLLAGFRDLKERIHQWDNFAARIKGFISGIQRPPQVRQNIPAGESAGEAMMFLFSIDEKTRGIIRDIIQYVKEYAPSMLGKVFGLILHQYSEITIMIPLLRETIDRQISLEAKADMASFIDQRKLHICDSFRTAYEKVFPEVHQRIYLGLKDKTQVPEALVEVFTDFLMRWGQNFVRLEDYHHVFFIELADRAMAKRNREQRINVQMGIRETKGIKLEEAVLKATEQNLRGKSSRQRTK